ncbi:hypothetical protein [Thalassovita sp.]|uniref:hypothetical protein n=1 Tax=Thalassovita sp. TaxID=1979401 RepID=UPI002B26E99C|nr:hypothetical protein [Thalassovita sp.]
MLAANADHKLRLAIEKSWKLATESDKYSIMQIHANAYPQLRTLCWNRPDNAVLDGPEALGLYENNWRLVEAENFDVEEKQLLDTLVARFGNGVFMPA